VTTTTGSEATGDLLAGLGVRPADAELTVVQFSTAFCGPCRATRARLQQLARRRPGLCAVQVDAESHLDAVRALDVRVTPTLIWVDRSGEVVARSTGAPRPTELAALVDAHTGGRR
jgi:thiol-disulfide isomerase/thioredoxin